MKRDEHKHEGKHKQLHPGFELRSIFKVDNCHVMLLHKSSMLHSMEDGQST